jgi:4,5-DOPA dioxygenase extradiol
VLAHLYPGADIPVVQLSINALKPLEYSFELGVNLATLQERGIMVVASGNVVHNLALVQWNKPDAGFDWAERFDSAAVEQLSEAPAEILQLMEHSDYAMAVPTPDHFIPLLYLAGMAAHRGSSLTPIVRGYSMGSISMTCYGLDAGGPACGDGNGAALIPADVPADQTNT